MIKAEKNKKLKKLYNKFKKVCIDIDVVERINKKIDEKNELYIMRDIPINKKDINNYENLYIRKYFYRYKIKK